MEQEHKNVLRNIFASWRTLRLPHPGGVDKAIYMLRHQYTDASISVAALKHSDSAKAQRLLAACEDGAFSVYLASLKRTVVGSVEDDGYNGYGFHDYYNDDSEEEEDDDDGGPMGDPHHILEIIEDELVLERIVDINGNEILRDVSIDMDDIIQPDPFDGREPDDQDYEGYTGNEGATTTHWYRDTVRLLA